MKSTNSVVIIIAAALTAMVMFISYEVYSVANQVRMLTITQNNLMKAITPMPVQPMRMYQNACD